MRLIDADKLYEKRFTVLDNIEIVPVYRAVVRVCDVKNAPTVEAIPIEWIKKWRKDKWFSSEPLEKRMIMAMGVRLMLEDWEEENEI